MMKLNTPKLLIVLAVLIGVFAVVKFTGNKSRSKSFKETLVEIDTARMTSLEITEGEQSTILTRKEGQWMVSTENGDKKAMHTTIRSLVSTLKTVRPARIASRSADKWQDFSVDETSGTRVKVLEGDETTLDIILGRFGVEGQRSFYTYVRLFEDTDTYVADDFMKMSISSDPSEFRNSSIARVDKDSLVSISFNYTDSAFTLVSENGNWYANGVQADSSRMFDYLKNLTYITSRQFAERSDLTSTLSVVYSFSDRADISIEAIAIEEGYVLQSSANKDEAWMDDQIFDKVFKGPSELMN
ncbi:MAG: DUF4340 domain-containing protein [Cyclobacteriaceae bacterium]